MARLIDLDAAVCSATFIDDFMPIVAPDATLHRISDAQWLEIIVIARRRFPAWSGILWELWKGNAAAARKQARVHAEAMAETVVEPAGTYLAAIPRDILGLIREYLILHTIYCPEFTTTICGIPHSFDDQPARISFQSLIPDPTNNMSGLTVDVTSSYRGSAPDPSTLGKSHCITVDVTSSFSWYRLGRMHREAGPAFVKPHPLSPIVKFALKHGAIPREYTLQSGEVRSRGNINPADLAAIAALADWQPRYATVHIDIAYEVRIVLRQFVLSSDAFADLCESMRPPKLPVQRRFKVAG